MYGRAISTHFLSEEKETPREHRERARRENAPHSDH